jgi:hypothetical protein
MSNGGSRRPRTSPSPINQHPLSARRWKLAEPKRSSPLAPRLRVSEKCRYPTAVSQLNDRTSPRRAPVSSSKRNGNFRFNLN